MGGLTTLILPVVTTSCSAVDGGLVMNNPAVRFYGGGGNLVL